MKHFSPKKILITLITIICLFSMGALSVQAAGVTRVCTYAEKNTTFRKDITGNGKADTIKLKLIKENSWSLSKVNVFVNGKKALSIDSEYSYAVTVNYIALSKKNVFLQIYEHGDNDYIRNNNIYKYNNKTKKLVNVLNFSKVAGGTSMRAQQVTSAAGSQIKVAYSGQPCETGSLECTYTFVFKNGKFRLKSNTTTVTSIFTRHVFGDAYSKYLAKNQFVADKTLKFYKSSTLKKVAFTVKKGDVLTLKKIKIAGGKTYLQFKKGSKNGWVRVYNDYTSVYPDNEHGWFKGILSRLAG